MGAILYNNILLLARLCLALANSVVSNRTSEVTKEGNILRLYPMSFEACLDECFYNDNCDRVVFNRMVNLCDLQNVHEPINEERRRGIIVVSRNDIRERKTGRDGEKERINNYTTACPSSGFSESEKQLGNMNRVGDRTVVNFAVNKSNCSQATFLCDKHGEWVNTDCKNRSGIPRDCDDLFGSNFRSGIYVIFPDGQNATYVYCDFNDTDGPWTVVQRRIDGRVSFDRPFKSYQEGFGDPLGNFWLGLDLMSAITLLSENTYTLKVVLFDRVKGVRVAKYSWFQVMNATQDYILLIGDYSGNAGNALKYHNGTPFTAYDRDMDTNSRNCAKVFHGGWWYMSCYDCNLNGHYEAGIIWVHTGTTCSFATMKLKRN